MTCKYCGGVVSQGDSLANPCPVLSHSVLFQPVYNSLGVRFRLQLAFLSRCTKCGILEETRQFVVLTLLPKQAYTASSRSRRLVFHFAFWRIFCSYCIYTQAFILFTFSQVKQAGRFFQYPSSSITHGLRFASQHINMSSFRAPTRRDSWPPTQMRLHPSIEQDDSLINDLDLSFIDDDPLNFFLTPAPSSQDDDIDMEMDFDAGIENTKSSVPIVRSISPSSLDGGTLNRLPLRPPTPPRSSGSHSPEPDLDMAPTPEDDGESYLRFGSSPHTPPYDMPFTLRDFADARSKVLKGKGKSVAATMLSPTPVRTSSSRGRLSHRPGPRPLGATLGPRRRTKSWSGRVSPHAWREPSPDVWSIEEETEEEVVNSEMGDSVMSDTTYSSRTRAIDIPAAKPKKKVRFALPVQELI